MALLSLIADAFRGVANVIIGSYLAKENSRIGPFPLDKVCNAGRNIFIDQTKFRG